MTFWKQRAASWPQYYIAEYTTCYPVCCGAAALQSTNTYLKRLTTFQPEYGLTPITFDAGIFWIIHQVVHTATTVQQRVTAQWAHVGLPPAVTQPASAFFLRRVNIINNESCSLLKSQNTKAYWGSENTYPKTLTSELHLLRDEIQSLAEKELHTRSECSMKNRKVAPNYLTGNIASSATRRPP